MYAFIQIDLQYIQVIRFFFISMCVPWELKPQPFALLTQCSNTEPQEHYSLVPVFLSVSALSSSALFELKTVVLSYILVFVYLVPRCVPRVQRDMCTL